MSFGDAKIGLSIEGGADQGENTQMFGSSVFNSDIGIRVDTQPETGTAENAEWSIMSCSFDYNAQQIVYVTGYGQMRFGCGTHFEWNSASASYPFDLSTAAGNRMSWHFDNVNILHTGGTKNHPATFSVGDNHDVRIENSYLHNLGGTGIQLTATGGPGGTPTIQTVLANVTGTGRFKCNGVTSLTSTSLPRVPTISPWNNMLADGGFDDSVLYDAWFPNAGGIGTLSRNGTEGHVAVGCLQVPITSAVSTTKSVGLLVPRHGARFVSVSAWFKLSAGSGSVIVKMLAAHCLEAIVPGTKPTLLKTWNNTSVNTTTLDATGWKNTGISGNLPRYELPDSSTHLLVVFDFFSVDNNGGNVFADDVHVERW